MIPIEPLENVLHEFSLQKERNSYQHRSSDCQTSPLISCVASPSSARRCPSSQIALSPAALCAALYRKPSRSSTNSALCSRCKPRWCEKYSLLPMLPRLPKFIRKESRTSMSSPSAPLRHSRLRHHPLRPQPPLPNVLSALKNRKNCATRL